MKAQTGPQDWDAMSIVRRIRVYFSSLGFQWRSITKFLPLADFEAATYSQMLCVFLVGNSVIEIVKMWIVLDNI